MTDFDWSRFAVRINIRASAEKLYWCWATREGIEYWFLRRSDYRHADGKLLGANEFVQKGDDYTWWWHGYSDEVVEHGEILDCNGTDFFQFRFGGAGICTIRIFKEQEEMICELVQTSIPTDEKAKQNWHMGCKTGWTFYMTNLKSLLEGGIDLRNKDENLQNVITA